MFCVAHVNRGANFTEEQMSVMDFSPLTSGMNFDHLSDNRYSFQPSRGTSPYLAVAILLGVVALVASYVGRSKASIT